MVATIPQIIGKINPTFYAKNGKELLKKYEEAEKIPAEEVVPLALKLLPAGRGMEIDTLGGLELNHKIIYDSAGETLEPLYFWTLDIMNDFGLSVEKLSDSFVSSPGSSHFAELGQRATIMQQQGTKILGDVNTVLRSVLNIIYDLKEFKIRLQSYDDLKSDDKSKKEAARLSLKQIWMDKVDIQKGNSSIKGMAMGQAGFQTLLDAFLIAKDAKDADTLDLNDRVKRLVMSRVSEFNIWLTESEKELKKRYELERTYLKSQVNSLKLYSRWAKPYLRAASALESKESKDPALVKTFNTIVMELSLFGKSEVKPPTDVTGIKPTRKYYQCVLIDFYFRGIPQRLSGQNSQYVFGGRTEITFRGYVLNEDEIKDFNKEIAKTDVSDVLELIEGTTTESLAQLQEEIDLFLNEKEKSEKEKEESNDKSNPFMALFGRYEKKDEKSKKNKEKKKEKKKFDKWTEETYLIPIAAGTTQETVFKLFDIYKKAHNMPSYS